jgi:hypothetical protein
MPDDPAIAQNLLDSRTAHRAYRQAIVDRRPSDARANLTLAAAFRSHAAALDPDQQAVAWKDEPPSFNHADLTQFYEHELAR